MRPSRIGHVTRGLRPVYNRYALGLPVRHLKVPVAYAIIKARRVPPYQRPFGLAGEAGLRRDVQQDREVWRQAAGGDVVDGAQVVQAEAAPVPLVGQGGGRIAVAEDDIATLQRG